MCDEVLRGAQGFRVVYGGGGISNTVIALGHMDDTNRV